VALRLLWSESPCPALPTLVDYQIIPAAHQQRSQLDLTAINRVHIPVALASMLLILFMFGYGLWRRPLDDPTLLVGTASLALLGSAFICHALTHLDTLTRARGFSKLCVTADRRPPLWPRLDQLTLVKIAPTSLPLRLAT